MSRNISLKKVLNGATLVLALSVGVQVPLAATDVALAAGQTPWLQRDNTGGKGDYELTNLLLKFQCRIVNTDIIVAEGQPGPGYHKGGTTNHGCWCVNSEQPGGCKNIEIKYKWQ